jgi:diguanylate cyclase (GGDEF)-like protein
MSGSVNNLPLWLAFLALNRQATRDGLTGLYNRRYFDETLADHIAGAGRYQRDLSLVMFDLDHFKQINDTEGHQAGDEVLRQFAAILKATVRKADIVCRYGGDEFAVILPETGKADAGSFVERVHCALAAHDWSGAGLCARGGEPGVPPSIRASAGIAALPCENLAGEADADLRARKKEFRQ